MYWEYWGHLEQIQANGVGTPVHPLVDHHFHLDIVGFGGCAKKNQAHPTIISSWLHTCILCIYLYIYTYIYIYTVYEKFQDRGNDFVYSQYVYIYLYI